MAIGLGGRRHAEKLQKQRGFRGCRRHCFRA
jgi:hypothetical protein